MQDNESEKPTTPAAGEPAPGFPISAFGQMIEAMGSRRMLLGSMFGAMAGGLPFALARSAAAAPPDVKGSPNIPIRIYSNTKGTWVLHADGVIISVDSPTESEVDARQSPPHNPFRRRTAVPNRAKGSPNVAVDVHQDENGTYVLFADGSFRRPAGNAGARGAYVEYFYAKTFHNTVINQSSNLIVVNGGLVRFQNPFREPPFTWATFAQDGNGQMYVVIPNTPGHINATASEWNISTFNGPNQEGGFFGIGLH